MALSLVVAALASIDPAPAAISTSELIKAIRGANIWSADYKIQAAISGEEADISTYRNPKATDKDCKIDAVLVARAAMKADPANIRRVKVTFYDTSNTSRYRQVMVREGDVKAFATREMSPDELLGSIDITSGEIPSTAAALKGKSYQDISQSPGVVEGPYKGERIQLLGRIDALKERGVGVQPFVAQFLHLEDQVRNGDNAEIVNGINYLSSKLNDQEKAYNDAHQAASRQAEAYGGYNPAVPSSGGPPPTSGRPPGGPGPGGMAQRMQQELGDMAPQFGPMMRRRYRVARKIVDLQDQGQIVDPYKRLWREIEDLVAGNDIARLDMKLQYAEHQLGLPSFREN